MESQTKLLTRRLSLSDDIIIGVREEVSSDSVIYSDGTAIESESNISMGRSALETLLRLPRQAGEGTF